MLTPTQIIEQMLRQVAEYDAAHIPETLDNALLRVEANTIFRILRVIEETSGQRFIATATGQYLDLIGKGMERPRLAGETDDEYRNRLMWNPQFWNDCTINGIKEMIKNYYGIDIDNDKYEETRIVELFNQAAYFLKSNDPTGTKSECRSAGWVEPYSDFGAEWLGEATSPGAFEVHLRAFQDGEEAYIKKRHVKDRLMEIRAAGIVVLLYFHMTFGADIIPPMIDAGTEIELIHQDKIERPEVYEGFEVIITNGEVSTIIASSKDYLSGKLSRRIVHDRQTNKCHAGYLDEIRNVVDPYEIAEIEYGSRVRRAEPFVFRQSKLRNDCWHFFYGVKYEERDVTIPPLISIPISAMANTQPVIVARVKGKNPDIGYIIFEITGNKGNRTVSLVTPSKSEAYAGISSALDLQSKMADSEIADVILEGSSFNEPISPSYRRQYKREPIIHTYYTRPNPMVDEYHHARCEDVHGLDFYSILEYVDFWWRVSTLQEGVVSTPSIPYKLTVAKTKDGASRFWWRVTTFDGKVISDPSTSQRVELMGRRKIVYDLPLLSNVERWGVQSVGIDLFAICASDTNMFVLDSFNPTTKFEWRRTDIVSVKMSQTPARIVLAKLNIGTIELDDPYLPWLSALVQDEFLSERIKIRFWHEDWMKFMCWRIDKIIESGFDGVVLNGLESWLDWSTVGDVSRAADMRELVAKLNNYVKRIKANRRFLFIAKGQEAWSEEIAYVDAIDGILVEDVFYHDNDIIAPANYQDCINSLNHFVGARKPVFVLDYVTSQQAQEDFVDKAKSLGFIPCFIDRSLSIL